MGHRRGAGRPRGVAVPGPSSGLRPVPRSVPQPVSCVPLYHPGRRDFPGPVGSQGFPRGAFPSHTWFKRWRAYAACDVVCSSSRPVGVLPVLRAQCPGRSLLTEPPLPRAPSLRRRYPPSTLLRAHAPIPAPPISLSAIALWEMSSPLAPSTAGRGNLPAFGLPFFPGVLRPLRRRFLGCT